MARAPRFEGSPKDRKQDAVGARKMGISRTDYEKTARDKREDAMGRRAMGGASGRGGPLPTGGPPTDAGPQPAFNKGGKVGGKKGRRR